MIHCLLKFHNSYVNIGKGLKSMHRNLLIYRNLYFILKGKHYYITHKVNECVIKDLR